METVIGERIRMEGAKERENKRKESVCVCHFFVTFLVRSLPPEE